MNSPILKTIVTLAAGHLIAGHASALTPFSDNFGSAKLNTNRWSLKNYGKGKLAQNSGRMNYLVTSPPTGDDFATLELRNNQPGFNESWETIVDVANTQNAGYSAGAGIWIFNASDPKDGVFLEFYGKKKGFNFIGITDDRDNPAGDISKNPGVNSGSMRVSFSKTTKLFTFWYDATGSADGFQWVKLCTFSPTGSGGDRRGNWNMNPGSGRFGIRLFGYSERQSIAAGKVTLDNFVLRAGK